MALVAMGSLGMALAPWAMAPFAILLFAMEPLAILPWVILPALGLAMWSPAIMWSEAMDLVVMASSPAWAAPAPMSRAAQAPAIVDFIVICSFFDEGPVCRRGDQPRAAA